MVALVGPNGAGKSTLLTLAAGIEPPARGTIAFNEAPLKALDAIERARAIAYLPQNTQAAWHIPVEALVTLGRQGWGAQPYDRLAPESRAAVDDAIARTGLEPLRHRSVQTLSGGERARAELARILATRADLILADEPCAALDPRHQLDALGLLREEAVRGASVVIALHDLELAERYADRITVLDAGRSVAENSADTGLSEEVLAQVFAVKRRHGGGFERA